MSVLKSLFPAAALSSLLVLQMPARLPAKDFNLKLDLDPLLSLPALWSLKPDDLSAKFSREGFKESPYFQWTKGGRDRAVFAHKPYNNVTVDVTILAGKVPVESAALDFKEGRVVRLVIGVAVPNGGLGIAAGDLDTHRAVCEAALGILLGARPAPQARFFGSNAERKVQSLAWNGANGVACLDVSAPDGLLRFTLAPPATDVASLAAQPVMELFRKMPADLFVNLDAVLATPALWALAPEKLDQMFTVGGFEETPFFKWLTSSRDGTRFSRKPYSNVTVDLTIFGGRLTAEEAVIEFKNGRAAAASVSLFNRGDSGDLDKAGFDARYKTAGRALGEMLKVSPRERKPTAQTAVKTTGWLWTAPTALALLEFNSDAMEKKGQPEFLRLKLSPPAGREQLLGIAAIGRDTTTLKRSELLKFVKREAGGDVFIASVPMVDQGDKGYCVVASCQRMFSYLHVQCDQHELATLAGSDADRGTSSAAFAAALSKIGNRFRVHFKPLIQKRPGEIEKTMKPEKFAKLVQDHVDQGLPLLWSLELGRHQEEPPAAVQSRGGHMRMIIGYNTAGDQILFSDSWGAGHELKRMNLTDALEATSGVYLVEPQAR